MVISSERHCDILLINPPTDNDKTLGTLQQVPRALPPIGLGYLAACLHQSGLTVKAVDSYAENLTVDQTVGRIKQIKPRIIGLSCLTPGTPLAIQIAQQAKAALPGLKVIFGGLHPTVLPDNVLSHNTGDAVVRGEGEITCVETALALLNNRPLDDIEGITWKKDGLLIQNPQRARLENLDQLPFPKWDILPTHLYSAPPHWEMRHPILPIFASRGCPFRCTFCSIKTPGEKMRLRTAQSIADEAEYLIEYYHVKQIIFFDAIFPAKKDTAVEICNEFIRRGIHKKVIWPCETRVDLVDEELLRLMKKAGCRRIIYGIESGSEQILKNIKKDITLEQVRQTIAATKKAGLEIITCFILGLPGETEDTARMTINFAKELNADFVKFNLMVPYPGTEIYDVMMSGNQINSQDWSRFTSFNSMTGSDPVYIPEGFSLKRIQALQKNALISFYFHPLRFWKYLAKINSWRSLRSFSLTGSALLQGLFMRKKAEVSSPKTSQIIMQDNELNHQDKVSMYSRK